jgi:hypothetical protein
MMSSACASASKLPANNQLFLRKSMFLWFFAQIQFKTAYLNGVWDRLARLLVSIKKLTVKPLVSTYQSLANTDPHPITRVRKITRPGLLLATKKPLSSRAQALGLPPIQRQLVVQPRCLRALPVHLESPAAGVSGHTRSRGNWHHSPKFLRCVRAC